MKRPRWWQVAALFGLVAFVCVQILAWQRRSRLGAVRFVADGPIASIRLADHADGAIVASTTTVDAPIRLPEGTYRVDATRPGAITIATTLDVARGQVTEHVLDLTAGQMGKPIPIDRGRRDTFGFVDFGTRRDLLIRRGDDSGLARHDLVGGRIVWDARWAESTIGALADSKSLDQAGNLDGDDHPDAVWDGPHGSIAVSGRTGEILWLLRPDEALEWIRPACWIGDIDGDGSDDLARLARGEQEAGWIEARSGRDNRPLWRVDLPAGPESVPLVLHRGGVDTLLAVAGTWLVAVDPTDGRPRFAPTDLRLAPTTPPEAIDRDGDGESDHWLASDDRVALPIDARSGRTAGLVQSFLIAPFTPARWLGRGRILGIGSENPRWHADPFLRRILDIESEAPGGLIVGVHSLDAGGLAWRAFVPGPIQAPNSFPTADLNGDGCDEVILARPVAPPTPPKTPAPPIAVEPPRPEPPDRMAIEAIDGMTGVVLWARPMRTSPIPWQRPVALLAGPDIDGDGIAEIFAASLGLRAGFLPGDDEMGTFQHTLFVEALAGSNGVPLWRWRRDLVEGPEPRRPRLGWRRSGSGMRPALIVRFGPNASATTWVLRPEDGGLIQELPGTPDPWLLDIDKDGIDELVIVPGPGVPTEAVTAFRGQAPTAWQRAGKLQPTPDLDGDGIDDALGFEASGGDWDLRAVSTSDGRTLWRRPAIGRDFVVRRGGDLDGDGIGDFLGDRPTWPWAVSGRTGQTLAGLRAEGIASLRGELLADNDTLAHDQPAFPAPWSADLDGDGTEEMMLIFWRGQLSQPWSPPTPTNAQLPVVRRLGGGPTYASSQTAIAAVDGRTGRVRWQSVLTSGPGSVRAFAQAWSAELDGEPGRDLILLCIDTSVIPRFRVFAARGRDGAALWSRPASEAVRWPDRRRTGWTPALAAIDLDGDGIDEVVLADRFDDPSLPAQPSPSPSPERLAVQALEGRDGQRRWFWEGPTILADPATGKDIELHWDVRMLATRRAGGRPTLFVDQVERGLKGVQGFAANRFRLDAQGRQIDARALQVPAFAATARGVAEALGPWVAGDPDGDGNDVLVLYDPTSDQLQAFLDDPLQPIWSRRPLSARGGEPSGLQLARQGERSELVLGRRSPTVSFGRAGLFDLENGIRREEPGDREPSLFRGGLTFDLATGAPVVGAGPGRLRVPLAADREGGPAPHLVVGPHLSALEVRGAYPIALRPPGPDPRLARPLPWADRAAIAWVAGSGLVVLVLLILPAWSLLRAIRTRSLRWSFACIAAIALSFAAYRQQWVLARVPDDQLAPQWHAAQLLTPALTPIRHAAGKPLDARGLRLIVGVPLATLAVALWAWRRRPLRILAGLVVASGVVALGWWLGDRGRLDPSEHYTRQDWYLIVFWGGYALGLVALLAWPLVAAARRLRPRATPRANLP